MVRAYTAGTLPEAYLIRDLLARAGIEAHVVNEHSQGAAGQIPFHQTYPEVWVREPASLDRARQLIRGFERAADDGAADWRCPRCGESNPASFEICWACGEPDINHR